MPDLKAVTFDRELYNLNETSFADMVHKLAALEKDLSREKGPFALYGLFMRRESVNQSELVCAAPWIDANRQAAVNEIAKRVSKILSREQLLMFSHVATVEVHSPLVRTVNSVVQGEHIGFTFDASVQTDGYYQIAIIIASLPVDPSTGTVQRISKAFFPPGSPFSQRVIRVTERKAAKAKPEAVNAKKKPAVRKKPTAKTAS